MGLAVVEDRAVVEREVGDPMLAAKLAFLTEWLLADMEEEERSFLAGEIAP